MTDKYSIITTSEQIRRAQTQITNEFGLDANKEGKDYLEAALDQLEHFTYRARQAEQELKQAKTALSVSVPAPQRLRQRGSFYSKLADLWELADIENRYRLREAFPDEFTPLD